MSHPPSSSRANFLCGLAAAAIGLFMLLVGLGVIPIDPRSMRGPLWIAMVAGAMFSMAGLAIMVGVVHGVSASGDLPKHSNWWLRLFYTVLGVAMCAGLASIGSWVAFGPGPRSFGGTGMGLVSSGAGELVGRIVFGFGAILTWLFAVALAVRGARKLRSGGVD